MVAHWKVSETIIIAIPHCEKAENYEALLPWNIDLIKVTTKDQ